MYNWIRFFAAGLLVLPLTAFGDATPEAQKWLQGLTAVYEKAPLEADLSGSINAQGQAMALNGKILLGDRTHQRVDLKMVMGAGPQGGGMEIAMLTVTDGTHTWTEAGTPMGKQVIKVSLEDAEKLAAQTGGLGAGMGSMDPLSLAEQLSETVDFELIGTAGGKVTLTAKLDPEDRGIFGGAPVDSITLVLDEETSFPLELTVGGGEQPFIKMNLENLKFLKESEVPAGSFTYTPPEGVQVIDPVQMMKQQQQAGAGGR